MNKKILAVAIAGALAAPSAFAAQDTSGMQYTSASEGFYGSLRLRFNSGGNNGDYNGHDDSGAAVENSSSRVGVAGSLDLGGGLEGFYTWELGVNTDNGSSAGSTRLAHVGLRGAFGSVLVGSAWAEAYNMTYGSTDVANVHSGNLVYNTLAPGRANNLIQYLSPDLNGFQAAIAVRMDNTSNQPEFQAASAIASNGTVTFTGDRKVSTVPSASSGFIKQANGVSYVDADNDNAFTSGEYVITSSKDDNDIDQYLLSAKYEVQGFTAAIAYSNIIDGHRHAKGANRHEDHTGLAYRLGYAQDNWYVNGWYGKDNTSDSGPNADDVERLSIAGGVGVGKVNLYAVYDAGESGSGADKVEDEHTTLGVQYNLGARSRVWIEYAGQDLDSAEDVGDYINIGLRHDF